MGEPWRPMKEWEVHSIFHDESKIVGVVHAETEMLAEWAAEAEFGNFHLYDYFLCYEKMEAE